MNSFMLLEHSRLSTDVAELQQRLVVNRPGTGLKARSVHSFIFESVVPLQKRLTQNSGSAFSRTGNSVTQSELIQYRHEPLSEAPRLVLPSHPASAGFFLTLTEPDTRCGRLA